MWILNLAPSWLFQLTFFLGIVLYLVATTLKVLPHSSTFKWLSVASIFFSTYMLGMQANHQQWQIRTHDLELKVKDLEAKSQSENVKIVERVITKREANNKRGEDIIKYVDREVIKNQEVIKYIEHCPKLPDEIVNTINKAAKP